MFGRCSDANFGFLTAEKDLFGTTSVSMYAPTPGGGSLLRFRMGVPDGTKPAAVIASTLGNAPYGLARVIVIFPVASSVAMPEMSFALPAS